MQHQGSYILFPQLSAPRKFIIWQTFSTEKTEHY